MSNSRGAPAAEASPMRNLCAVRELPAAFPAGLDPRRLSLIRPLSSKWLNGTVLRYCFVSSGLFQQEDGTWKWFEWKLDAAQLEVVRAAFKRWKDVDIGLSFVEVTKREEADIRIGFLRGDGAWSYVGRAIREAGVDELTMNLGWDVTNDIDTPIHEIGHTLGFSHEHQNPNAGIVWDEEAVYAALALPPNEWQRDKTFFNIIRKIPADTVQASTWDPDSIMHYPFEAGLIRRPAKYSGGLTPAGGLSKRDLDWVRAFYPPVEVTPLAEIAPLAATPLSLSPGVQSNFVVRPRTTREYEFRTFGEADTVLAVFEDSATGPVLVGGNDDSGTDSNAYLKLRLRQDTTYVARVRVNYAPADGESVLMYW